MVLCACDYCSASGCSGCCTCCRWYKNHGKTEKRGVRRIIIRKKKRLCSKKAVGLLFLLLPVVDFEVDFYSTGQRVDGNIDKLVVF